jgi:hypothetical protein
MQFFLHRPARVIVSVTANPLLQQSASQPAERQR